MVLYISHWSDGKESAPVVATTPGSALQTVVTELRNHGNVTITNVEAIRDSIREELLSSARRMRGRRPVSP